MSGERQGWQTWSRFQDAGIVGKHVNFTDDNIVTDHVLGKTGQKVGKCWPMDAAVAYTLAAAGPNAELTTKDMINEYTKMASVMMTQKIAYGKVPNPKAFTCGHDEITALRITLHNTELVDGAIRFTNDIPESDSERHSFRMNIDGDYVNYNRWGLRLEHLFSDSMKEIREAIEVKHNCNVWYLDQGIGHSNNWYSSQYTMGECGVEGECNHHKINRYNEDSVITTWAMLKDSNDNFTKLWSRDKYDAAVHDGWNTNGIKVQPHTIPPSVVTLWSDVNRTLGSTVNTKLVLKQINAALRRMTSRNNNIVSKTGKRNTATYRWKEWGWLTTMQSKIANTSKKNRKAGDIVNGWRYEKYDVRKSFGHEIAKFRWVSQNKEDETTYLISLKGSSYYNSSKFPFRFTTKSEAVQYKAFITMMAEKCGANSIEMQWDATKGQMILHDEGLLSIQSNEHGLIMTLEKEPEDLLSPSECIKHIFFGTPQENKIAREQIEPIAHSSIKTINESTNEKGENEE